ncbi:50S ribosomal protein L2 [Candidatus Micrarchaeota archaeon]|nr:50S ribosomal protein L2 [Candidatus Micrarchaeota archaeon]
MGKPIIAQRKGKGSPAYRAPSHRFFAKTAYPYFLSTLVAPLRGQVIDFIDDPGHGPLLAEILLENGQAFYNLAPEGLKKGDEITLGPSPRLNVGSVVPLANLVEGTPVYNVEIRPGDGGKLARACGAVAYVSTKEDDFVELRLRSKAVKKVLGRCLATIGVASGGGKTEKPYKKAGNKMRAMLARGREWPKTRRSAMSAYNHPFGGKSFGKPTTVSRSTPPGRKVGHIAARRVGRKKGVTDTNG